jgi:hypothetical protein
MADLLSGAVDSSVHQIDNSQDTADSAVKIQIKVIRPRAPIALVFADGERGADDPVDSAMENFGQGFGRRLPMLMFGNNTSITSRAEEFKEIMEVMKHCNSIGGRGMGGKVAISCVKKSIKHLILVSYPLRKDSDLQDAELLALPPWLNVIFVSGDRDHLLDIDELDAVREKMKAQTWRVIVRQADHSMHMMPDEGTEAIGMEVGVVIAEWLSQRENNREGEFRWNDNNMQVEWSGWVPFLPPTKFQFRTV